MSTEKISSKKIRFNSGLSETLLSDSIVQRIWKFGDGSSLDGNQINPLKEYKDTGVYNVCIQVRTAKGCEKIFCLSVIVRDSVPGILPFPPNCKAAFSFSIKDSTITFNSESSRAASEDDSIISRTWYYADNSTSVSLTGNVSKPSHTYSKPGSYNVYLVIKTKKGCESKYAGIVVIAPRPEPVNCKANFIFITQGSTVKFNGSTSVPPAGDSIISRVWSFGDSSTPLTGNHIDPSHQYAKEGNYTACLSIKTKRGCESKYCVSFSLRDSVPWITPANCKAVFTFTIKDSTISFNSEGSHAASAEDSIISRTWYYMDSSTTASLTGNVSKPSHTYSKPGSYNVYLVIKTKKGCESKYAGIIVIAPRPVPSNCKAAFSFSIQDSTITFNSESSRAASEDDSIISRTWYYADNSTSVSLTGNVSKPSHTYSNPGSYKVYLVIKTKKGCESKYAETVVIAPRPVPANCKALFTFRIQNLIVNFNSTASNATSAEDSIISRIWFFGDSTVPVQGNSKEPSHTYKKGGTYTVYLYIKTKKGCESKYAATVVIVPVNCTVQVNFTAERISSKKVQFNSSLSSAQGDSIIQRNWKFGNNTILSGNQISPVKEFPIQGVYTTCLRIKTIDGCEAELCKQVVVQDSVNLPQTSVDYVKIISINPNPVVTRMMVTIWSRNNNVEAELSIFDIYGTGKSNIKKVLVQGNNVIEIPTESLYHGPYFFKVSTKNGRDTKAFYKL